MKVIFISDDLLNIEVTLPAIELESVPLVGDWVDVSSFTDEKTASKIESHFDSLGKLNLGIVNGRSWGRKDDSNVIYIHLLFNLLPED